MEGKEMSVKSPYKEVGISRQQITRKPPKGKENSFRPEDIKGKDVKSFWNGHDFKFDAGPGLRECRRCGKAEFAVGIFKCTGKGKR